MINELKKKQPADKNIWTAAASMGEYPESLKK